MNEHERTIELLEKIAKRYDLSNLGEILRNESTDIFKKDIFISLKNIVRAFESEGDTLELLKGSRNVYDSPIFSVNPQAGTFLIKKEPDFEKAIDDMEKYSFCFKLSPYHIINTYLAVIEAQITGLELEKLYHRSIEYLEDSITDSLNENPNWDKNTLINDQPLLIIPIGAAGCGKSTLYRELSDVVNISCDNIRYLLFKSFGPCFGSWESCLSWWVVNHLTDNYLEKGYHVFYNGVNTDLEYRSPITMEDPDPLFAGMSYETRLVYFEPPVELSEDELKELKGINLWKTPIDEVSFSEFSPNVSKILEMINNNYKRTQARTKEIAEGKQEQDPFDVLYTVPAPVVKLFVEQSFNRPSGNNVTSILRKELPDASQRKEFYQKYAQEIMSKQKGKP